jgi:hypothetical protein
MYRGNWVQLIPGHGLLVWNIGRLIDGAKILGLPVLATEQYPKAWSNDAGTGGKTRHHPRQAGIQLRRVRRAV